MTLEQQVTNLEISERLKELGVKQESFFVWWRISKTCDYQLVSDIDAGPCEENDSDAYLSAFTVSELGVLIPRRCQSEKSYDEENKWFGFVNISDNDRIFRGDNEAEVRGRMLIYLLENKLI